MNEQEKLLADLNADRPKHEFLGDPEVKPTETTEAPATTDAEVKDEAEENPEDNREARRAKRALREERKASAFMAEKLANTNERVVQLLETKEGSTTEDHLAALEKIFGVDTPEAQLATSILKNAFKGTQDKATEAAIEKFREEQREIQKAEKEAEESLNSMIDDLEEEFDIDLSSPQAETLRKGFFKRLEKLSPKDQSGNILHFADHYAVFEDYYESHQKRSENKTETRAKDVSSRSMANSSSVDNPKLQVSAEEKWLRDKGII